jgi:hypothetical protein
MNKAWYGRAEITLVFMRNLGSQPAYPSITKILSKLGIPKTYSASHVEEVDAPLLSDGVGLGSNGNVHFTPVNYLTDKVTQIKLILDGILGPE